MRRFGLLCSLPLALILMAPGALASPIYVYKEADGVIRFSNKPPPPGAKAEVFTAKGTKFSMYKMSRRGRSRLYTREYSYEISRSARRHGLDPNLIRAVIHAESAFQPTAVSPKGALGLMQLMPFNTRRYGVYDPFSPAQNIDGGSRHLSGLVRKYQGNLRYALAAYNAGEKAVEKYGGIPPYSETRNYVTKVLQLMNRYRSVS